METQTRRASADPAWGVSSSGGVEITDVAADEAGLRLDRWFHRRYPGVPHGRLEKWLRSGQIRVDGGRAKAGLRLRIGQRIRIPPFARVAAPEQPRVERPLSQRDAANLLSRVIYRDEELIAIDKPAGLPVQGGTGTRTHLDGMLRALYVGEDPPRLVHRLDKDTSGVLVLARTAAAAARLAQQFRTRRVRKLYWALVAGVPVRDGGTIDLPLSKLPGRLGEKVEPDPADGKRALTRYRVVERAGQEAAWITLEPMTGRTHQLRAHCAAVGTPILGDGKYGGTAAFLGHNAQVRGRLHLHARALKIPRSGGNDLLIEAPLPQHLEETWRFFGFSLDPGSVRRAGWNEGKAR